LGRDCRDLIFLLRNQELNRAPSGTREVRRKELGDEYRQVCPGLAIVNLNEFNNENSQIVTLPAVSIFMCPLGEFRNCSALRKIAVSL
jgi:hypothetical protein